MPDFPDVFTIEIAVFSASIVLLGFAGAVLSVFTSLFNATKEPKHFTSKILTAVSSTFLLGAAASAMTEAWQQDTDMNYELFPIFLFFIGAALVGILLYRAVDARLVPGSGDGSGAGTEPIPPKKSTKAKKAPKAPDE